jgi:hypothetical protein
MRTMRLAAKQYLGTDRRAPSLEKIMGRVLLWSLGFDILGRTLWAPQSYVSRLLAGDPTLRYVCLVLMTVALVIFAIDIFINDVLPDRFSWTSGSSIRPITLSLMSVAFFSPLLADYADGDLTQFELWSVAGHGAFFITAALLALRSINRRKKVGQ